MGKQEMQRVTILTVINEYTDLVWHWIFYITIIQLTLIK